MTIDEAIENLEERKAFLKRTCEHCWDDAIEMALQALKAKRDKGHNTLTSMKIEKEDQKL